MIFFENFYLLFKSFVIIELSYVFTINMLATAEKVHGKENYLIKTCVFFSCW